jgi:siroheme synthase
VPAALNIPLTHREHSSAVTFITGHSCGDDMNWQALVAGKTTIVIYMGMIKLPEIVAKFLEHGLSPLTPAAVIENGTLQTQRSIISTVGELCAQVEAAQLTSPAIIVIGNVVSLAKYLAKSDNKEPASNMSFILEEKETANVIASTGKGGCDK